MSASPSPRRGRLVVTGSRTSSASVDPRGSDGWDRSMSPRERGHGRRRAVPQQNAARGATDRRRHAHRRVQAREAGRASWLGGRMRRHRIGESELHLTRSRAPPECPGRSRSSGTICATSGGSPPELHAEDFGVTLAEAGSDHLYPGPERWRPTGLPAPADKYGRPLRRARPPSSSASRLLPIPGSPLIRNNRPWPANASSRPAVSAASSSLRPTKPLIARPPR